MASNSRRFRVALSSLFLAAALITAAIFTGCGGGGGSGGSSDSGSSSTRVDPDIVREGGFAYVSVKFRLGDFDDLDTQGLTIKLLIPSEFGFIHGASSLTLNRGAIPFEPVTIADAPRNDTNQILAESEVVTETETPSEGAFSYYVFSIPASTLEDQTEGQIQMSFNVGATPANAVIFTDLDRGETKSFDSNNADFDAESVTTFKVSDGSDDEDDD